VTTRAVWGRTTDPPLARSPADVAPSEHDVERGALIRPAEGARDGVDHEVAARERRDQVEQLPGEVALGAREARLGDPERLLDRIR